jgi:(p)ppGpp synthase/HD superfamily hydrolase
VAELGMLNSLGNLEPENIELFQSILDEAEQYLNNSELGLIVVCGIDILSNLIKQSLELNEYHLQLSFATTLHLTQLGLKAEYLACSLLYFPMCTGEWTSAQVGHKFGKKIEYLFERMLLISNRFEHLLPWVADEQEPASRKSFWMKKTSSIASEALLNVANSPELALVKLVERLQTLDHSKMLFQNRDQLRSVAEQSISVYAGVAEMLGIWQIKSKLEDEAFKILDHKSYEAISLDIREKREARVAKIDRAIQQISRVLENHSSEVKITGRPKHFYGIFRKMQETGKPIQEVNDILGVRIIVGNSQQLRIGIEREENAECYLILSTLLNQFDKWPGAVQEYGSSGYRDWIDNPKRNGYQSIHTAIMIDDYPVEIQIRTVKMHEKAEYGAAAHWRYKKQARSKSAQKRLPSAERIAAYRKALEISSKKL